MSLFGKWGLSHLPLSTHCGTFQSQSQDSFEINYITTSNAALYKWYIISCWPPQSTNNPSCISSKHEIIFQDCFMNKKTDVCCWEQLFNIHYNTDLKLLCLEISVWRQIWDLWENHRKLLFYKQMLVAPLTRSLEMRTEKFSQYTNITRGIPMDTVVDWLTHRLNQLFEVVS